MEPEIKSKALSPAKPKGSMHKEQPSENRQTFILEINDLEPAEFQHQTQIEDRNCRSTRNSISICNSREGKPSSN